MESADDGSKQSFLKESIARELEEGRYVCCICIETIRSNDQPKSCRRCFQLTHLECLRAWAQRSTTGVWECPRCRATSNERPNSMEYRCFCGKVANPPPQSFGTPHSCDGVCSKLRELTECKHPCTASCHPGPCPPCPKTVELVCHCGKVHLHIGCSEPRSEKRSCGGRCDKLLRCRRHRCKEVCHEGPCSPCLLTYPQSCFCGKKQGVVRPCQAASYEGNPPVDEAVPSGSPKVFSCGEPCPLALACGNHACSLPCHAGSCPECHLLPVATVACACGKTPNEVLYRDSTRKERTDCTDPLDTCGKTCGKPCPCGVSTHNCKAPCHNGDCPPCPHPRTLPCKCGTKSVTIACADSEKDPGTLVPVWTAKPAEKADLDIFAGVGGKKNKHKAKAQAARITLPFTCTTRCTAQKDCFKHTCKNVCCPQYQQLHLCELRCSRMLSCGKHKCPEKCHAGECPPCLNSAFTELSCRCGVTYIEPPVPCGTEPPVCDRPCAIPRPCGHRDRHRCHFGPCPSCTAMSIPICPSHGRPMGNWDVPCGAQPPPGTATCDSPCYRNFDCGH
eukprot:gene4363-6757_t